MVLCNLVVKRLAFLQSERWRLRVIAMDCVGNDGSVEEFYLVLLDGRLEYSVRICC